MTLSESCQDSSFREVPQKGKLLLVPNNTHISPFSTYKNNCCPVRGETKNMKHKSTTEDL